MGGGSVPLPLPVCTSLTVFLHMEVSAFLT